MHLFLYIHFCCLLLMMTTGQVNSEWYLNEVLVACYRILSGASAKDYESLCRLNGTHFILSTALYGFMNNHFFILFYARVLSTSLSFYFHLSLSFPLFLSVATCHTSVMIVDGCWYMIIIKKRLIHVIMFANWRKFLIAINLLKRLNKLWLVYVCVHIMSMSRWVATTKKVE